MNVQNRLVAGLGLACMAAAVLAGILQGLWEKAHPILVTGGTFATASATQRWCYAMLALIKSVGFLAGLFGFFRIATKRGWIVKSFMGLGLLGAVFFSAVWLVMAATAQHTLVYVLGGMWYQIIAPVVLGIASLRAHRIPLWASLWTIFVGLLNSQIFALLKPDMALMVQGVIWVILGCLVYIYGSRAEQTVGPEHVFPNLIE